MTNNYKLSILTMVIESLKKDIESNDYSGICFHLKYHSGIGGLHLNVLNKFDLRKYQPDLMYFGGYWFPVNKDGHLKRIELIEIEINVLKTKHA